MSDQTCVICGGEVKPDPDYEWRHVFSYGAEHAPVVWDQIPPEQVRQAVDLINAALKDLNRGAHDPA